MAVSWPMRARSADTARAARVDPHGPVAAPWWWVQSDDAAALGASAPRGCLCRGEPALPLDQLARQHLYRRPEVPLGRQKGQEERSRPRRLRVGYGSTPAVDPVGPMAALRRKPGAQGGQGELPNRVDSGLPPGASERRSCNDSGRSPEPDGIARMPADHLVGAGHHPLRSCKCCDSGAAMTSPQPIKNRHAEISILQRNPNPLCTPDQRFSSSSS